MQVRPMFLEVRDAVACVNSVSRARLEHSKIVPNCSMHEVNATFCLIHIKTSWVALYLVFLLESI